MKTNSLNLKVEAAVSSDRKEMSATETLRHDYNQTNCLGTSDRFKCPGRQNKITNQHYKIEELSTVRALRLPTGPAWRVPQLGLNKGEPAPGKISTLQT